MWVTMNITRNHKSTWAGKRPEGTGKTSQRATRLRTLAAAGCVNSKFMTVTYTGGYLVSP